jgi:hypothetical protein
MLTSLMHVVIGVIRFNEFFLPSYYLMDRLVSYVQARVDQRKPIQSFNEWMKY